MNKVLLTGASGFIGQEFVKTNKEKYDIRTISLRKEKIADINFEGIETVIHLAGMAHQMQIIDPKIYFDVNFQMTKELAKTAKLAGVKQFVFASTVKVFGNHDINILTEESRCNPVDDPYGESKLLAEKSLQEMASSDFIVSIIRPPLVYGAGVKGNLQRLMGLVKMAPFLPFGGIENKRSMVYVGNLIALIEKTIEKRVGGVFIGGDREPHSTSQLVQLIAQEFQSNTRLFRLPKILVFLIYRLRPALAERLFSSFIIDNTNTNKRLDFVPPFTFDHGIKEMVRAYQGPI